ncbi:hypothetical protein MARCHEWKA_02770 [Brevundimonas phage vB_BpoS-Marchewka]|uniref:Uncharacterized protein n=1 Tax=Brevundimonas phage vB_BpoS-Marchewka TaxID=2948604 RepID=A0A9E7SR57_9CAUD|nr:hypothetical protein MARCHEWKA_02770 [Brevundimonas phage vB_BpoS-Marchewka]
MGRSVKRVALDFVAPMTAWAGYIRPDEGVSTCPDCGGLAQSPFANHLQSLWWGQHGEDYTQQGDAAGAHRWTAEDPEIRHQAQRSVMASPGFYVNALTEMQRFIAAQRPETPLTEDDLGRPEVEAAIVREAARLAALHNTKWMARLTDTDLEAILAAEHGIPPHLTGTFDREAKVWVPFDPAPVFTARQISAMNLSHSQIGQSACMDRVIREAGESWDCPNPDCHGGAVYDSPGIKAALDAWVRTEPPEGEGWQMWQTVSDGPISPVFATAHGLAHWMARSRYSDGLSSAQWLKFITGPGWSPSAMGFGGEGIEPNAVNMVERDDLASIFDDIDQ